ncbi:hypothetical protein Bbelb_070730 [Branchiostoma belcheri]|nr:hypothetical protein Bbelb_070730 [Branchiostoma belcheri]
MAPKNESCDEHQKICKLQAYVRGMLVRRKLRQLRQQYEALVQNLADPACHVDVTWTSTLPCVPTVLPKEKSLRSRMEVKQTADKQVVKTSDQGVERLSKKDASTETVFPQNTGEDCSETTKSVKTENTEHFQTEETVRKTTSDKTDDGTLDELQTCSSNQELGQFGLKDGGKPPQSENQDNQTGINSSGTDTSTDAIRMEEVQDKGSQGGHLDTEGRYGLTSEQCTPSQRIHGSTENGNPWSRNAACESVDLLPTTDTSSNSGPTDPDAGQASLAEQTSVWELEDSFPGVPGMPVSYPTDPTELGKMRSHISMELLWVQQAITSRKNYLRMKHNLEH